MTFYTDKYVTVASQFFYTSSVHALFGVFHILSNVVMLAFLCWCPLWRCAFVYEVVVACLELPLRKKIITKFETTFILMSIKKYTRPHSNKLCFNAIRPFQRLKKCWKSIFCKHLHTWGVQCYFIHTSAFLLFFNCFFLSYSIRKLASQRVRLLGFIFF